MLKSEVIELPSPPVFAIKCSAAISHFGYKLVYV